MALHQTPNGLLCVGTFEQIEGYIQFWTDTKTGGPPPPDVPKYARLKCKTCGAIEIGPVVSTPRPQWRVHPWPEQTDYVLPDPIPELQQRPLDNVIPTSTLDNVIPTSTLDNVIPTSTL